MSFSIEFFQICIDSHLSALGEWGSTYMSLLGRKDD